MPSKKISGKTTTHAVQQRPSLSLPDPNAAAAPAAPIGAGRPIVPVRHTGKCMTVKGVQMDIASMDPHDIAATIELFELLVRPYGCGPMAPSNWVVFRTYQKIVEMRDELRMDEEGFMHGDRTFKRCYQSCLRTMARFNLLSPEEQKTVTAAGWKGHRFTTDDPLFLGPVRAPSFNVEHTFRFLMDKFWHRYLLPFGCYAYEKSTQTVGAGWERWKASLISSKTGILMNPYSVTAADILYLCNTSGYLDRLVYIVGIILWAKKEGGVNLLRHVSPQPRDTSSEAFDRFMTMEKHLHLFGSIYMHRKVLEMNNQLVTHNWKDTIALLSGFLTESYSRFGLSRDSLNRDIDNMIVDNPKANTLTNIQAFFPNAARIGGSEGKK